MSKFRMEIEKISDPPVPTTQRASHSIAFWIAMISLAAALMGLIAAVLRLFATGR